MLHSGTVYKQYNVIFATFSLCFALSFSGKIQTKVLKNKIIEMNPYGNVDMLLQIIDDVDLDNDGTIDYEEFLRALHPDFNETPNWFWEDEKNQEESDDEGQGDDANDADDSKSDHSEEEEIDVHDPNDRLDADVLGHAAELGTTDEDQAKKIDDSAVLKQGYMQKEGKMVKSWKKRYFVLQKNGVMSYYHNNKENVPIAKFNVKDMTKLMNKSWSKTNKKRYGIKVYTPHRNWKFLCADNKERISWLSAFEIVSGTKAGNKATD